MSKNPMAVINSKVMLPGLVLDTWAQNVTVLVRFVRIIRCKPFLCSKSIMQCVFEPISFLAQLSLWSGFDHAPSSRLLYRSFFGIVFTITMKENLRLFIAACRI